MKLYHGTDVPDLKILRPNSRDGEGRPALYLTDHFPYSLFYIRDRATDFVTCGIREDGTVHYDEKFSGQLETLYRGRSGWVYEVDVEAEPTKTRGIYVVRQDAPVTQVHAVPDALSAILDETEKGWIRLLRYEELSQEQKVLNRDGMVRYFLSGRELAPEKEQFLRQHFPEAWVEAQNILAQSR